MFGLFLSLRRAVGRGLCLAAVVAALAGCQNPDAVPPPYIVQQPSPNGGSAPLPGVDSAFLTSGGDSRLITLRPPPSSKNDPIHQEILCSEPSPDWATAFATLRQLSGQGSAPGGPSASLQISSSDTETIAQMAGRTAGVVALRDGLYSACQAYANGIIGRRPYALILSQYGDLLVALTGGGTSSTLSASVLSQQALQALLVTCLTTDDRTSALGPVDDPSLVSHCRSFLKQIITTVPAMLKPPGPAQSLPKVTPQPVSVSRAITALQQKLVAAGERIAVDGRFGPEAAAALQAYLKTHPTWIAG